MLKTLSMLKFLKGKENKEIIYLFFIRLLHTIQEDNNVFVLNAALEVIQELALNLGPAAIDTKLEGIVECLVLVLRNETHSQNQAFEVTLDSLPEITS